MSADHADRNLIARLLGPSEAEVSCERCFELLDQYVELELAGENADARLPGMRAHLAGLPGLSRGPREPARARRRGGSRLPLRR